MDAPPPHEDPGPFLAIARWLGERGFAAPRILADDAAAGLALLEDFGDVRMRETVDARPDAADRLSSAAIDGLVARQYRQSSVEGRGVAVRVDVGGRRIIK